MTTATRTTVYRYRVVYDDHADLSYLEQDAFSDIDPADIVSFGVIQERRCPCCDSWNEVDACYGFDAIEGTDDAILPGVFYAREALPTFMAEHFIEDDNERN